RTSRAGKPEARRAVLLSAWLAEPYGDSGRYPEQVKTIMHIGMWETVSVFGATVLITSAIFMLLGLLVDIVATNLDLRRSDSDASRMAKLNHLDLWSEQKLGRWWALRSGVWLATIVFALVMGQPYVMLFIPAGVVWMSAIRSAAKLRKPGASHDM